MQASNWFTAKQKVQPIGLDIGHSHLKMVQVALREERVRTLAVQMVPLDRSLAGDNTSRRQALVQTIRQLLAEGGFRGRNVVSAVPVDTMRITSLRLADAEAPDVDRALRTEAAERFGLDPQVDAVNYLLAGSVHQGDEVKNEYILFAVDHEAIRQHIRLLEEAGLTPVGIDAPAGALFRAFERTMRRQEDRDRTIIFLDVGYRYTIVVFGRADGICFVKHIPLGLSRFDDEIAATLEVSPADAELLRRRLHRDESMDAPTRRHLVDALNTVAEQLAGEVSLCLRYYTVTFRGKRVEHALVAGGGAHEPILLDVLRRHLSVDLEVAEPLRGCMLPAAGSGPKGHPDGAPLALAIGLSLKGWQAVLGADALGTEQPEPVPEGAAP
jgi:type IV pilus assembly protein PilM